MDRPVLLTAFQKFIHDHRLINPGDRILAAVSGGIDSMALLDLLATLREPLKLEVAVAHFNFQLRGEESAQDEEFVRAAAKERGLACFIDRADTVTTAAAEKQSIQEAARNLRYRFFDQVRQSTGFDKIATAHHADDNAETILLNLARGAGVAGLSGIPMARQDLCLIRPLLFATRGDITTYAKERRLPYREDSSNAKSDYTRNFLRHEIIPLLQKNINPNLAGTLARTGMIFEGLETHLRKQMEKVAREVIISRADEEMNLSIPKLQEQEPFLQEYFLQQMAAAFCKCESGFEEVQTLLHLARGETGKRISIGNDVTVHKDRDELTFRLGGPQRPFTFRVEINKEYLFDTFSFRSTSVSRADISDDPNTEYIEAKRIPGEMVIRSWREGDWFIPFGMKDRKKLSDYFIDEKLSRLEKTRVPILVTDNTIIWVCGKRLDNRFRVTPTTEHILKLEYQPRYDGR